MKDVNKNEEAEGNNVLTKRERKLERRRQKEKRRKRKATKDKVRRVVLWGMIAVALAVAALAAARLADRGGKDANSGNIKVSDTRLFEINDQDRVLGPREAPIVLVEYSDFECPACASYRSYVKRLHEELGERVVIVYRHMPLSYHKNAKGAAWAAEAAGEQGKFWEMHEALFDGKGRWVEKDEAEQAFIELAKELELDIGKWKRDFESGRIRDKVERDLKSGIKLGVKWTPSFYLNGKLINNPKNYDEFKRLVEKAGE